MPPLYYIGFDPGGDKAFGWSIVGHLGSEFTVVAAGTCSSAQRALTEVTAACPHAPHAVAIDAPLFWSTKGDRNADRVVRKMVCAQGGHSGTVSHVNSLRGACLVQGVLVARMATELWPETKVSEAQPKALLAVSTSTQAFLKSLSSNAKTEHERDATIAAYTAQMFADASPGWHNLALLEQDIYHPVGSHVAYWFPKTQA